MILYIVKFPKNYWPREIAYTTWKHAKRICKNLGLEEKCMRLGYMEEDEKINSFQDNKEKIECKWCGGLGFLYTSKAGELMTEECPECNGKGFYEVE